MRIVIALACFLFPVAFQAGAENHKDRKIKQLEDRLTNATYQAELASDLANHWKQLYYNGMNQ